MLYFLMFKCFNFQIKCDQFYRKSVIRNDKSCVAFRYSKLEAFCKQHLISDLPPEKNIRLMVKEHHLGKYS